MEIIDLGSRPKYEESEVALATPQEDKVFYPELHICDIDIDDDMDIGDETVAKVRLRKCGEHKNKHGQSKTYEVLSIAMQSMKEKDFSDALDAVMQGD